MADYRLSAQIISRSKGQSSIASAAYRAAARLHDERTGETHDYTRKGGVVYSAVLAPDNAPEWMRDRARLWQAVEAVEKRKDAQLAREVQLSLPHELTPEQRQALVVGFVREQYVAKGMIADVAIHTPNRAGDERNHHAHIMLTLRSLTGDGFGKKPQHTHTERAAALNAEREAWALRQNRELERHGHAARVDHRSFETRGIDREAEQHRGPVASDIERKGRPSRIGDENRATEDRNAARADNHNRAANIQLAIQKERQRFDDWAHERCSEQSHAQDLKKLDLSQKHDGQRARLETSIGELYGTHKATIIKELEAVHRRLEAGGIARVVRDMFGRTKADRQNQQDLAATLRSIGQRENEQRTALALRQAEDRRQQEAEQERRRAALAAGIEKARGDP